MRKIFLSLTFIMGILSVSAQSYEPEFNMDVNVLSINGSDTVCVQTETSQCKMVSKKNHSLFGKIAGAAGALGAVGGLVGVHAGNLGMVKTAIDVSSTASVAERVVDATDLVTGASFIKMNVEVKGTTSTCKASKAGKYCLVVRLDGNNANPAELMQIMSLEAKKKTRLYTYMDAKKDGSTTIGTSNDVPFKAHKYGAGSYLIEITPTPGEYAVSLLGSIYTLHCFSIPE